MSKIDFLTHLGTGKQKEIASAKHIFLPAKILVLKVRLLFVNVTT